MPDDPHEECDGHDGQEHPQSNRRVEAELGVRHGDTTRRDLALDLPLCDLANWLILHRSVP